MADHNDHIVTSPDFKQHWSPVCNDQDHQDITSSTMLDHDAT